MDNQTRQNEKLHDDVTIFKIYNSSELSESLKNIKLSQVFTSLKSYCTEQVKVCTFFIHSHILG